MTAQQPLPSKVASGELQLYPADFFNLQIDMASKYLARQQTKDFAPLAGQLTRAQFCHVENNSGSDRDQFDALKITGIVFTPSDNLDEFQQNFAFTVGTTGDDTQPIVVLLEPIRSGEVGRAVIDGMVPARIQVNSATDRFAILDGSSVGRLKTDASQGVQIIYKAGSSGEQWSIVRLGGGSGSSTRCRGVLDDDIPAGSVGTVSLWRNDVDSGENIEAWYDWITIRDELFIDERVIVEQFEGKWVIVDYGCPPVT